MADFNYYSSLPSADTDDRLREIAQLYADNQSANTLLPSPDNSPKSVQDVSSYLDSIAPATKPNAPSIPSVADYIKSKAQSQGNPTTSATFPPMTIDASPKQYGFGEGMDDTALQNAQALAGQQKSQAGMFAGIAQLANGLSGSNKAVNEEPFQQMAGSADDQVKNVLTRRKAAEDQQQFSQLQENEDPNSVKAYIMRQQLAPLAQKVGLDPTALQNLSVSDLKSFSTGPLEFAAKLKQQQQTASDNLEMRKLLMENQTSLRDENRLKQAYDSAQNDEVVKKAKGSLAEADTLLKATDDATQNPISANALAALAARYVSGGQRINRQEMEALGGGAKDVGDKLNQIVSTGRTGTLTPENAAFMKQFVAVTRGSAQTSYQDALKSRADGYSKALNIPKEKLYDLFGVAGNGSAPSQGSSSSDQEAVTWAKSNPTDPRAKKILQVNGM